MAVSCGLDFFEQSADDHNSNNSANCWSGDRAVTERPEMYVCQSFMRNNITDHLHSISTSSAFFSKQAFKYLNVALGYDVCTSACRSGIYLLPGIYEPDAQNII